jgi:hypothetical protein
VSALKHKTTKMKMGMALRRRPAHSGMASWVALLMAPTISRKMVPGVMIPDASSIS